jgi:AcrR family transcriptional regulator
VAQRRKRLLDVPAILDAALALADERGRITMGELAERLGVSASSVYHHVSGRGEIIERLRERLAGDIEIPPLDGSDWGDQVSGWMRSYRRMLARHPNLIPSLMEQPMSAASALRGYDRVAALLTAVGFPEKDVIVWITLLDSYALGAALQMTAPLNAWQTDHDTPALDAAVQAGPKGAACVEDSFELGLDLVVDGMRSRLTGPQAAAGGAPAGGRVEPIPRTSTSRPPTRRGTAS